MIIRWYKAKRARKDIRGPFMDSQCISIFNVLYQIYIAKNINGFYSLYICSSDETKTDLSINGIPMSKYDDSSILVFAHELFDHYITDYDGLMGVNND